jgi:hypothetical protein
MSTLSKISPALRKKISKLNKNQAIPVIVQLKSLEQEWEDVFGKKEREKLLDNYRKEMLSFENILEELQRKGRVLTYRPYSTISSVYVKAKPSGIMELTDCDEVLSIIEDQGVKLIQPEKEEAAHILPLR